jgi:endo-1,4-beta-xylanase
MRATIAVIAALCAAAPTVAQLPKHLPEAIPLWPRGAPGSEVRRTEAEHIDGSNVSNVHNPSLTPYWPSRNRPCPAAGVSPTLTV